MNSSQLSYGTIMNVFFTFNLRLISKEYCNLWMKLLQLHCVKTVRFWSFSGPYFPAFGGKIRIRKTPNTDTFYVVLRSLKIHYSSRINPVIRQTKSIKNTFATVFCSVTLLVVFFLINWSEGVNERSCFLEKHHDYHAKAYHKLSNWISHLQLLKVAVSIKSFDNTGQHIQKWHTQEKLKKCEGIYLIMLYLVPVLKILQKNTLLKKIWHKLYVKILKLSLDVGDAYSSPY